ncbi:hypothetical protein NEA10_09305 [Phormidium yuhuli AB48]|uniref:Uncharacterized protein n=1 Tax=Phormidium yuhuli AB48 TaxID=2940671 RepID=A0ABY5AX64_9CYAN|nr:hypothetical protein [Phormidium yuhuli]USR92891.1 hypothetical protein NEA10_09305 [Phormidium yuhuli AB48]
MGFQNWVLMRHGNSSQSNQIFLKNPTKSGLDLSLTMLSTPYFFRAIAPNPGVNLSQVVTDRSPSQCGIQSQNKKFIQLFTTLR